jgi:hypothetical protein
MGRRWATTLGMLWIVSLAAAATAWQETGWTATVVTDRDTGLPAVMFNMGLAYDETPEKMQLRIAWEVYSMVGGARTVLYEYASTYRLRDGTQGIHTAPEPVLIEQGTLYGADVDIADLQNGLTYTQSYRYFAPRSIPVGLRTVLWDGTEEVDLYNVSDTELEALVQLQRRLATYEVLAENVSLDAMFAQYAAAGTAYPLSVILLPETGVDNNWGSESKPITVSFGLTVQEFTVPTRDVRSDFQEQVALYDQAFTGTVYSGTAGSELGEGAVVFVHDSMRLILESALAERASRSQ